MGLKTPVALIIFKRPDTTARVMEAIRQAQPRHLLIIADGPRTHEEAVLCKQTRSIAESVDWDCEVKRNYAETNLGLGERVRSGLHWVFDQHEDAIVLEDDCVPDPTFFQYCEELLEFYRDRPEVMIICGAAFPFARITANHSYFFTRIPITWGGFASWRRAWKLFTPHFNDWEILRETDWLLSLLQDPMVAEYWAQKLDSITKKESMHTKFFWTNQWIYQMMRHEGLSIMPVTNLLTNIGFDGRSTNTRSRYDRRSNLETTAMKFPIKHPPQLQILQGADRALLTSVWDYKGGPLKRRLRPVKQYLERVLGFKLRLS